MAKTLVGFDTETTGKDPKTAEVLQIGAVVTNPNNWDTQILYNQKSRPSSGVIDPEASEVHGVYMEQLQFQPSDETNIFTFSALLDSMQEALGNVVVVSYNGEFYDLPILRRGEGPDFVYPHIDVFRIVQRVDALFKHGLTLSDVYAGVFQETLEGAHDAVPDVKATIRLLQYIMELLDQDIEGLLLWMEEPVVLEKVYFGKHVGKLFKAVPRGYLRWIKEEWDDIQPDLALTIDHYVK